MTDALNHLAAFNRIAYALENLPPDDLMALIAAIDAIANKTIPVADLTGVATAIANIPETDLTGVVTAITNIPETDLTGVVTAINNISISGGGGTSTGVGLDCACLDDVIGKLTDKIDQMICVIAPIAAANIQLQKIIAYIGMDGPNMGIDAPPGTFIFPVPGDISPPLPYTPDPDPLINTTDPTTGEWTAPPIINGIAYDAPPGGMQGATDSAAYNQYKCDAAFAIIYWLKGYYDNIGWIVPKITTILGMGVAGMLDVVYWLANLPSGQVIKSTLGASAPITVLQQLVGYKAAETLTGLVYAAGMTVIYSIAVILFDIFAFGAVVAGGITQMMNLLETYKAELACALIKAKTIDEARNNFLDVIDLHADTLLEKFIGRLGNGQIALINALLTDNMLAILFACPVDLDPADIAGLGTANGGCVDCILCADMDESLTVNQTSVQGYPQPGDIRTGLVPWPITVDLGTVDTDVICIAGRADWINGGAIVKIWINGADAGNYAWGGNTDTIENMADMPFLESLLHPISPATRFTGHVVLEIHNEGITVEGLYEISTVSWRLPE
jgi:hypothetical protein